MALKQAYKMNVTIVERRDEFLYNELVSSFISERLEYKTVNNFLKVNPSESDSVTIIRFINGGLSGKISKVLILQCADLKALDCKVGNSKLYKGKIPTLLDELCRLLPNYKNVSVLISTQVVNKSTAAYKKFSTLGDIVLFKPMSDRQYKSFIKKRCKMYGIFMDEETISYFLNMIDHSCAIIDSEIKKLSLIGIEKINRAIINETVMKSRVALVFELVSALVDGKFNKSIGLLSDLLGQGVSSLQIIALLQRNFRILLYMNCGCDIAEFKLNKWVEQSYKKQLPRFGLDKTVVIINKLLEAEKLLKTSHLDEDFLLSMIIFDIV